MWNIKRNNTNELTHKTETDSQTYGCQRRGRMEGRDSQGVWDGHVHTAIFKMDNQQGATVQHMEFYMWQYYVTIWMAGDFGGNGYMYIYG